MWPFASKKYKTLTDAVRSGDLRAVQKMLKEGADPNVPAPNDDTVPLFYALHEGPEMVRLLIEYGADVNLPGRRGATALAEAESQGLIEVAAVLRAAGARLRTGNEEFAMDPRLRLQIEDEIRQLVFMARICFPTESPDTIAERVEEKLNLEFPKNMPPQEQETIRKEVRALIKKECGVKDYLCGVEKPVPSPEDIMAKTGMSEDELTRRFVEHLIQEGKNPFEEAPEHILRYAERKFPDLVELARRKFGTSRKIGVTSISEKKQVPRTWENLPSMVMTAVPPVFSYSHLVKYITDQAPDKQLVCLVTSSRKISQEDAERCIQLLYEFADDPLLVLMRFLAPVPGEEWIIIRAWFMRETVSQVNASKLFDLAERLSQLAREKGLNTITVE